MIRVGFVLDEAGSGWTGGFNYFRSLLSALSLLDAGVIQPVVFAGMDGTANFVEQIPRVEVVRSWLFNSSGCGRVAWHSIKRMPSVRTLVLPNILARHRIDVLSHWGPIHNRHGIKTIGWIPDFQHARLPEFFNDRERSRRDQIFGDIALRCDRAVVSSAAALADLQAMFPSSIERARVLHFVPDIEFGLTDEAFLDAQQRYHINEPYFYLPNQFWKHKNHGVVIRALATLNRQGVYPLVLSTGNTTDYRNPRYFASLKQMVEDLGLGSSFRILGIVPYAHVSVLMRNALAVINPSLFEGWSSTVEEAKALDKVVVLSDLPVHREQNPRRGVFFRADDHDGLAAAMSQVLHGDVSPLLDVETIRDIYTRSRAEFAVNYQRIVRDLAR